MLFIQRSFHLLNAPLSFLIFLVIKRSVHVDGFSLITKISYKGNNEKNPAILGFFFVIERTQLNSTHKQLFEKLRLGAFAETCRFSSRTT